MRGYSLLVAFLFGLLDAHGASAIVIRHDREDTGYLKLGSTYRAVCAMNLPGGEGTLIAPDWILTAAHVAKWFKPAHGVSCGGASYLVSRVVLYPGGSEGKDDLALGCLG